MCFCLPLNLTFLTIKLPKETYFCHECVSILAPVVVPPFLAEGLIPRSVWLFRPFVAVLNEYLSEVDVVLPTRLVLEVARVPQLLHGNGEGLPLGETDVVLHLVKVRHVTPVHGLGREEHLVEGQEGRRHGGDAHEQEEAQLVRPHLANVRQQGVKVHRAMCLLVLRLLGHVGV